MENISFTSRIRPVDINEFRKTIKGYQRNKNFVDYPWTIKQSRLADKAYTADVVDCTVCGLTDGEQVLLMHICPDNPKNSCFNTISEFIKKSINIENPDIQGFLLGSKSRLPKSTKLFDNFVEFMKKHKIPFSMFKDSNPKLEHHVAYSSITDEWLICNRNSDEQIKKNMPNPLDVLKQIFNEVKISDVDEVSW